MARKRKSKPTGPRRREEQRVKDRLAHAQDDARRLDLLGNDPLLPEEALTPEVVDPTTQSEQRLPTLISRAIRRGWAVPEDKKPGFVDELAGVLEDPDSPATAKILAFGALVRGDQIQHERDQKYIHLDRVLAMWKGVLEAIRNHVQDQELVKLIVADVLRFLPAPPEKCATVGVSNEGQLNADHQRAGNLPDHREVPGLSEDALPGAD